MQSLRLNSLHVVTGITLKKSIKISNISSRGCCSPLRQLIQPQKLSPLTLFLLVSPKQTEVAHNGRSLMIGTKKKLTLLDTIISLPIDPAGMMRHLLRERRYPPYLVLAPLSTFFVLVVPTLWYQHYKGIQSAVPEVNYSIATTVVLTLVWFSLLMSVLFRVLLLKVSSGKVWAASLYCITGLVPFMLAFYLGNFLASGHLSIVELLATGHVDKTDWCIELFPTWARIALIYSFFLFVNAVRALTGTKFVSSFSMAVLAIPVLIGSFVVSLTISDILFQDTGLEVYRFFTHLLSPAIR